MFPVPDVSSSFCVAPVEAFHRNTHCSPKTGVKSKSHRWPVPQKHGLRTLTPQTAVRSQSDTDASQTTWSRYSSSFCVALEEAFYRNTHGLTRPKGFRV